MSGHVRVRVQLNDYLTNYSRFNTVQDSNPLRLTDGVVLRN